MSVNDGGPAFPRQHAITDANDPFFKMGSPGMSLRDWFAGMALAGFCADNEFTGNLAELAYNFADSMLKERSRELSLRLTFR